MRLVLLLALVVATCAPSGVEALVADRFGPVIRRHMAEVRGCYVRALERSPSLAGRITVRLDVDPRGTVTVARATEDTIGDAPLTACVLASARSWVFPPVDPHAEVETVEYPFVLAH